MAQFLVNCFFYLVQAIPYCLRGQQEMKNTNPQGPTSQIFNTSGPGKVFSGISAEFSGFFCFLFRRD